MPHAVVVSEPESVSFRETGRNLVHRHTFFEPCLVVAGRGEFEHGGERFDLAPGDLFVADPGVYHEIRSLPTRDLQVVYTWFALVETDATDPRSLREDEVIGAFLGGHAALSRTTAGVGLLFDAACAEMDRLRVGEGSGLLDEIMRVVVLRVMAALTITPADNDAASVLLSRALAAIESRLAERLRVVEIAEVVGVSERTLRRLFRDRLGRGVVEEVQRRRINRAASLLAMPELTVGQIAGRVGIPDPAAFSRLFTKVRGTSPRSFRRARLHEPWGWADPRSEPMRTEFATDSDRPPKQRAQRQPR